MEYVFDEAKYCLTKFGCAGNQGEQKLSVAKDLKNSLVVNVSFVAWCLHVNGCLNVHRMTAEGVVCVARVCRKNAKFGMHETE